jgi:nitrogen fixation NifU-like protein
MPGLEDLYKEIILDHYKNPRNRGELECPPAHRTEGFNPLCGDEVTITFELGSDSVDKIRIAGQGCSISQASASMMSAAVQGKSIEEVRNLSAQFKSLMSIHEQAIASPSTDPASTTFELGDLDALKGVVKFPVRIKCATLSWNTLLTGLDELKG